MWTSSWHYFKTMDVIEETFDETESPVIVAYRRRITETGKLLPITEGKEYPYHIHDVVQMTAEYTTYHPEKASKVVKGKLTSILRTIGRDINQLIVDWTLIKLLITGKLAALCLRLYVSCCLLLLLKTWKWRVSM